LILFNVFGFLIFVEMVLTVQLLFD